MNPTFGVSTWLWTSPFTTETVALFPRIREMGFSVVEIPAEYPELIDGKAVKAALDAAGLTAVVCAALGPSRDLTHEDPQVHTDTLAYLRACMDLCLAVGATFVAGPLYSAVGKARQLPPDKRQAEWDLAVRNLHTASQMAAERGLLLALEPLNRFESDLVNTAADAVRLVEDIGHPAAKVMLDSFHMSIEERDPGAALRQAAPYLIHLQVSENHRGIPGTGQTPWQAYRSALQDMNYQGVISIESFTPEVKELAGAVCIWKPFAPDQDYFARTGLSFLQQTFQS
ncbi:MAG: sugar phosphate isomerase/epimerase family protein [Bacteroidia bacterium]|nr:sugar phosphate isomerase/epimerase family protein [Bacteroidia bacterium]